MYFICLIIVIDYVTGQITNFPTPVQMPVSRFIDIFRPIFYNVVMNEKQLEMIHHFVRYKTKEWVTASALAAELNVSTRTVKSYASQINDSWPGLILSSPNGYRLDKEVLPESLASLRKSSTPSIPQTTKERVTYTTLLLLRSDRPVSLYGLCDEMFISMSTLQSVLKRIRRRLSQFGLQFSTANDCVEICGNEHDRRRMLSSIIFEESNAAFFNLEIVQDTFDDIDTDYIMSVLQATLLEGQYYVNDFSTFNILLHIVIAIDRNLNLADTPTEPATTRMEQNRNAANTFAESTAGAEKAILPLHIYEMARRMGETLGPYFGVRFQDEDIYEFALLFYTRANSLSADTINEANLEMYIGRECVGLLRDMLDLLWQDYDIELTNEESRVRFALHIKSLLIRSKTRNYNRNPLTDSIKTSCPLIYDVAVKLSAIITEKTGFAVIDDEIAYIAFHIGNALETQRAYDSKISVILNCPTYYNMSYDLHEKLMGRFGNDIIVTDITVSETQFPSHPDIDLILSTVPLKDSLSMPCIQIHPFFTMADASLTEHAIARIKAQKQQQSFLKGIRKLIFPEFFEHLNQPMTKEEVLHYMCTRLCERDFADERFESDIMERERLSSTGFVDFAIPHTMNMCGNHSCMYILINDTPIQWDENAVKLVIMLCFNASDRQVFNTVFEPLSISLLNRKVIQQILQVHSCDEFIGIISEIS